MTKPKNKLGYKFTGLGLTKSEINWGRRRFQEYRKDYPHLYKMADMSLLEELIFQEALHERIKNKIAKITEVKNEEKDEISIPSSLQEALKQSIDIQFKLKDKLSLFEDKKALDVFKTFQETREDFAEYRRQNPDLFHVECPSCKFNFYLKRRTKDYEYCGTEWFKDKVLFNLPLWEIYKNEEKLTKEKMAKILGVSVDHIDYLEEKFIVFINQNKD